MLVAFKTSRGVWPALFSLARGAWQQVAVAVVQRMQMAPASIPADVAENFATELHDRWGVGDAACHNGVLLLLAVQDRQVLPCLLDCR